MIRRHATALLAGLSLTLASLAAHAQGQIIIGDVRYVCQNSCVVSTDRGGNIRVSDSQNGWVYAKHEGPAEVSVPPEP